ncbi:LysE family efflux protein [Achromobacter xylosoxidans NBRC 15126 = ATCC 27061]|nr:LysE family efflux protein [Achromobacter xylosoxidans NBRC 15126 = ATCC 27061]
MPLSTWLTFFLASWAISFSPGAGGRPAGGPRAALLSK